MSNSKNAKSQPLRSNDHLPKAGPKSNGGGRHQNSGRNVVPNQVNVIEAARQDRLAAERERREQERQKIEAEQIKFRTKQAILAMSMLNMSKGPTCDIAELIINNFIVAKPDLANKISRTAAAELMAVEQMTMDQLKNNTAFNNGKFAARRVLNMAYEQLKNVPADQTSKVLQLVEV